MLDVKESEKNVRPAVEAVLAEKRMSGIEVRAEVKRLTEEQEKIWAAEEAERMEVVRQIRALESVPVDRINHFDPTSVSDASKHLLVRLWVGWGGACVRRACACVYVD